MSNIPPGAREIESFRSFFKGREDVFARFWKKGNKSGYMPAYLERSKSGRGSHVWVFWRRPYIFGMLKRIVVYYQKTWMRLTKH